jgi:hypothetical protein
MNMIEHQGREIDADEFFAFIGALAADRNLSSRDVVVGTVLAKHCMMNRPTLVGIVDDETIVDETGGKSSISSVKRSRGNLEKHGWFSWTRTGDAYRYQINDSRVLVALDR